MNASFFSGNFLIASIILLTGLTSWSPVLPGHNKPFEDSLLLSKIDNDILNYVNEYRTKKGLPKLAMNPYISLQAEKHSSDMASNRVAFGHDGFENRVKTISRNITNIRASAENVAYGKLSPKEVVDNWLKSPGHRKNIEGNFTLTGIGTAMGKDKIIYFTQIFTAK